jgi:hypothetical protein
LLGVFAFFNLDLDVLASFRGFNYREFAGAQAGSFFALVMVLVVFLREEYSKGQVVYRSLPVSGLHIVLARYASVCLIIIACMLYGHLFQYTIFRFSPRPTRHVLTEQIDAGYALEHSLIARGLAISSIAAVAMPLVVRFPMFWGILGGYIACLFIWSRLIERLLAYSLHTTFFLGLSRWTFFAVVFMIAINVLSLRLSVWLYGQRDL